jgi:hypothetical protein
MSAATRVSVEFVDAETGKGFARTDMPVEQLPDSFAPETTVHLGGDPWVVERADPVTAAECARSGRLVLTVRRIVTVSPRDILYSLPTVCDRLPPFGPSPTPIETLELHEDDWRQVEFVSRDRRSALEEELAAIERVYESHSQRDAQGRVFGFREIHVRRIEPLTQPVPWSALRALLPAPDIEYGAVSFRDHAGAVAGSFALGYGPLSWYGLNDDGAVPVLALRYSGRPSMATVADVLRAFDLLLVDWCRRAAVDADHLAD